MSGRSKFNKSSPRKGLWAPGNTKTKKKSPRKEIAERVLELSGGILSKLGELLLFQIAFSLEFALGGSATSRGAWAAYHRALNELSELEGEEGFDFSSIKNAFYRLKRKGFIEFVKEEMVVRPAITEAGRKRLEAILPSYDEERTWDGRIYLVTYDIPEEQKGDRELLREYLKRLGAGQLQLSVFMTPYNPKGTLKDFLEERKLKASVIVSDLGEDGSIGDKNLKALVAKVYDLGSLNRRYAKFVDSWGRKGGLSFAERGKAAFEFLDILDSDPQLPFELLPKNWKGEKAYQVYQRVLVEE